MEAELAGTGSPITCSWPAPIRPIPTGRPSSGQPATSGGRARCTPSTLPGGRLPRRPDGRTPRALRGARRSHAPPRSPATQPRHPGSSEQLATAARLLHDAVKSGTVGARTITKVNGSPVMEPIGSDQVRRALEVAGFGLTPRGYRVSARPAAAHQGGASSVAARPVHAPRPPAHQQGARLDGSHRRRATSAQRALRHLRRRAPPRPGPLRRSRPRHSRTADREGHVEGRADGREQLAGRLLADVRSLVDSQGRLAPQNSHRAGFDPGLTQATQLLAD